MSTQAQALIDTYQDGIVRSEIVPVGSEPPRAFAVEYTEIAPLAYEFWQRRGCPNGSPEEDWFRAEQELIARRGNEEGWRHPA